MNGGKVVRVIIEEYGGTVVGMTGALSIISILGAIIFSSGGLLARFIHCWMLGGV